MRPATAFLAQAAVAAGIAGALLAAYDRVVLRPAVAVAVVDLAAVYRAKEAQFTRLLTQAPGEAEREAAQSLARAFARRLPAALEELGAECACLVLLKSAVAAPPPHARDLTDQLRRKVEAP